MTPAEAPIDPAFAEGADHGTDSPEHGPSRLPLKVLFVADSVYWVTGTLARNFSESLPWIEPTICSTPILSELLDLDPDLLERVDIVHLLDPWGSAEILPRIRDSRPSVATVYHVEEWSQLVHNTRADALMVIAREWEKAILARGFPHARLHRVPLGVDSELFSPPSPRARTAARRRLGIPAEAFTLGSFAKISPSTAGRKGVDILLAALTDLHREIPDLAILIVGPGWRDVVREIRQLAIRCRWVPFVLDHADLPLYYHALDAYWVTSRVEGGPATLLEAMASGLPCISTPVGMAPEILRDGINGFLAPSIDAGTFTARTLALAKDEALRARLGTAARSSTVSRCQWRHADQRLRRLYETAVRVFDRRRKSITDSATITLRPTVFSPPDRAPIPLTAVAPRWRRRTRMKEHLYWLRKSSLAKNPWVALKVCLRAWRTNPLSVRPLIHFLRSQLRR